MPENQPLRDTCLWPLDSCLKHDAATKAANGCPRERENWNACAPEDRAHPLETAALDMIKRNARSEPVE